MEIARPPSPDKEHPAWRFATTAPALAAAVLGALYAGGAFLTVAQQVGAGQDPFYTLPLVPLEQILSRGIHLGLSVIVLSPLLVIGPVFLVWLGGHRRNLEAWWPTRSWAGQPMSTRVFVLMVPFAALLFVAFTVYATIWLMPVLVAIGALVTSPTSVYFSVHRANRLALAFSMLLTAITLFVAAEFLNPTPLPQATLLLREGDRDIRGGVVSVKDGTWYVATEEHSVIAVPIDTIQESQVTTEDRPPDRTIADLFG